MLACSADTASSGSSDLLQLDQAMDTENYQFKYPSYLIVRMEGAAHMVTDRSVS